jgi:Holliday junction resolvase RusA-like endonuclease
VIDLLLVPKSGKHFSKKNSVIRTRNGVRNPEYVVAASRDYHTQARAQMGARALLTGPLRISLTFVAPWTSAAKPGSLVCVPDTMNLAALVADALEGAVYINDAQLVEIAMSKAHGKDVAVLVSVGVMT